MQCLWVKCQKRFSFWPLRRSRIANFVQFNGVSVDKREFRYVIDSTDRIVAANAEWFDFARENGAGWLTSDAVLGRPLWDFITDPETRMLYREMVKGVREQSRAQMVPFRCDSPDRRRFMELTISKNPDGALLFLSRVVREESREPIPFLAPGIARGDSVLVMCGWCKKVRVGAEQWVEVEAAVKALDLFDAPRLPRISHGICSVCSMGFESFGI